jgi:hypothetical protein
MGLWRVCQYFKLKPTNLQQNTISTTVLLFPCSDTSPCLETQVHLDSISLQLGATTYSTRDQKAASDSDNIAITNMYSTNFKNLQAQQQNQWWFAFRASSFVGLCVGFFVGFLVGLRVGIFVGFLVGLRVGIFIGFLVGLRVGMCVGLLVR